MIDFKNELNNKQYEAVTSNDKYLRIIAGAGSGKTRVLTFRIAYLINELGYYPSSIMAITFTNKAAEEINNRVAKLLNTSKTYLRIGTFHSICARILREEAKLLSYPTNFTIIDDDDQKKIIKEIIKDLSLDEKVIKIASMIDYIASRKNNHISPEYDLKHQSNSLFGHQRAMVYDGYQKYLMTNFLMDFDDLILNTIKVFEENEICLEKWQNKITHILVDEFQDTDNNQYRFLQLLAGNKNEITVVGDPDQTIYTWRGANIDIILHFDEDFMPCKTISLEENYRSTGKILAIANKLIEHNHNRIKKNLFTNQEDGMEISQFYAEDEAQEAKYVINNIKDLYDGENVFYKDFAILYRNNSQSQALEKELMNNKMNYKIFGGIRFYKRLEIKDCIAYLRLALNHNDDLSCKRLIENTLDGVGQTTQLKISDAAKLENKSEFIYLKDNIDNLESLYKPKQGKSLTRLVNDILLLHDNLLIEKENSYKYFNKFLHDNGYIDRYLINEENDRVDNIKQFINQMQDFFKEDNVTIEEFVQNVTLMSSQDEIDDNDDYVKLMTIHTAKGLEFKYVFIFGLIDQIFPSQMAMQEDKDGLEAERRLFYVAITRAMKRLFLSTSGGYGYTGPRIPSRFLREINFVAKEQQIQIKHDDFKEEKKTIKAGTLINHEIFGEGIVISCDKDIIDVVFKDPNVGKKKLLATHKFIHVIK